MNDREIRSDSKLKGDALTEEQHQELWDLRYPAGETDPMGLEDIAATEVPRICGVTCAPSTLSDYYKWAKARKRIQDARQLSKQAEKELLEGDMETSLKDIEDYGQFVFTSEMVANGNAKAFAMLKKLKLEEIKVKNDSRRIDLLEATAKKANEAEEVTKDDKLSNDEKQARLKSIFGIG